jgi:hypothetical protein
MSNDVVILLLDGPAHGLQMQSARPVPATIKVVEPEAEYVTLTHTEAGLNYRIGLVVGSAYTAGNINDAIAAFGFQPSWDLNPPFRQTAP